MTVFDYDPDFKCSGGGYVMPTPTDLCPKTIQACIDALPPSQPILRPTFSPGAQLAIALCHEKLKALLPKPDPAEELVKRYIATRRYQCLTECMPELFSDEIEDEYIFARWLISNNMLKEG